MKFLLSVLDTRSSSASESEMSAIAGFNAELRRHDALIFAGGLAHAQESITFAPDISPDAPRRSVVDEGAHFVSGMWIIEAPSSARAHSLAFAASQACNRLVECRAFLD